MSLKRLSIGLLVLAAIEATSHAATAQKLEWEPAIDPATVQQIRGIPYEPESGLHDWSINRATNTLADVTRIEVRRHDRWIEDANQGDNSERAELDGYRQAWGERADLWAAYSFLIEPGLSFAPHWNVIGQFHNAKGIDVPLRLEFTSEFLRVYTVHEIMASRLTTTPHYSGRLPRNVWHHIVLHWKRTGTSSDRLEVWLNGENIVDYTGSIGIPDESVYWKFGIYRGNGPIPVTFAIQFANMEIGTADLSARIHQPLAIELAPALKHSDASSVAGSSNVSPPR